MLLLLSVTMAVICIYYYNMEFILFLWVECGLWYGAGAGAGRRENRVAYGMKDY